MSWAHYILQVNIYLVVFYGFYKLLLDKETYFVLNRIYLVSAGILSLSIPFLRFEWFKAQPVAQTVYTGVEQLNTLVTQIVATEPTPEKISMGSIVVLIYLSGVLFLSLRFILRLLSLRKLLTRAIKGTAFSFFQTKMVDQDLPGFDTIHKHEEIHARQLHSLDVLFFEILGIMSWFNPITYLYKATVKSIHEFLADEEAARFQGNKEEYALLLLSNALGVTPSALTNNFYSKSLIKKRIYMLHKQRSAKIAILKYGLFVPLFGITLLLSSATISTNEQIQKVANEIPLDQPLSLVKETVEDAIQGPDTKIVKTSLPGTEKTNKERKKIGLRFEEWEEFYEFIAKQIRYPLQAQQKSLEGNSQVKFSIKNGEIEGLGLVGKPLGLGCDAELINKMLAYKNYKTKPDGNYSFIVSFRLQPSKLSSESVSPLKLDGYTSLDRVIVVGFAPDDKGNAQPIPLSEVNKKDVKTPEDNQEKVYDFTSLDQHPSFHGGMQMFYKYISENIQYPAIALQNKIQGKVFLSFVVEKDGNLTDIKVDRKLGGGTDEEAVRVIKASPRWLPGSIGGEVVRVKYNIPISFSLTKP